MSSVHNSGSLTRIVVITGKTRPPGKIILGEVCVRATLTKGKLIEQHEKYRRKQLFVVISHNSRLLVKKLCKTTKYYFKRLKLSEITNNQTKIGDFFKKKPPI